MTSFGLWVAALAPSLLAVNVPPSSTLLNQAVAYAAWGLACLYAWRGTAVSLGRAAARCAALPGALALVAVAAVGSWAFGVLPGALALSAAGTLVAAAVLVVTATSLSPTSRFLSQWCFAWLAAGAVSAVIACVQVFAPGWTDGDWIAHSPAPGRAVGNLRQPNHLASLLLWAAVALVPLLGQEWLGRSAARRVAAVALFALLILTVMLSGSRTGGLGVLVLCAWGLLDRRLPRFARGLLISAPLIYALSWGLVAATSEGTPIGAAQRVGQEDLSSGRFAIWSDTLALMREHPWLGVGFGEFNLAWTLTPFPDRSPQFFDHTHNLPLQLLVELGLPLGLLVLALLAWALWQAWRRSNAVHDERGTALRATFVMVLLMGVHSMAEYPLWYAHFLLPTAFAWGLCLGATPDGAREPRIAWWPVAAGLTILAGTGLLLQDYRRVTVIFTPPVDARPLTERIEAGRTSALFPHHAEYALATSMGDDPAVTPADFRRATHYLLDTRLMMAWSTKLAEQGDLDRARWIAARLREFRNPLAEPFFAPCSDPAVVDKPFQCAPPSRSFSWRDFR